VNEIERRVRNLVNPYSTAFARWWCHSGRYMLAGYMSPRPANRVRPDRLDREELRSRVPEDVMAKRRAAIDALMAETMEDRQRPDQVS
jgi:hypothetical protein